MAVSGKALRLEMLKKDLKQVDCVKILADQYGITANVQEVSRAINGVDRYPKAVKICESIWEELKRR